MIHAHNRVNPILPPADDVDEMDFYKKHFFTQRNLRKSVQFVSFVANSE
jgi:hypothetical protein